MKKTDCKNCSHYDCTDCIKPADLPIFTDVTKFAQTVQETEDDFIFTTIKDYCESVSEMKVSKAVLRRALYWFKTEHKEEYEYLTRREEEE